MIDNKVTVIGLGEIGFEIFKELNKNYDNIIGVDISIDLINKLKTEGYKVEKEIPISNIYILAVYITEQVFDVIKKIQFKNNPLIIIESTLIPGTYKKIQEWKNQNKYRFDLVLFPHRYNPRDKQHHIFNLNRIMGGDKRSIKRAINFYKNFMSLKLIHQTTTEIAELSKPLENAYRFIEIAIAEEIKMLCDERNINFNKLREAMNTKWNISLKEARDGIDGKCLPKDTNIINNFFNDNTIFKNAIEIDEEYKNKSKG